MTEQNASVFLDTFHEYGNLGNLGNLRHKEVSDKNGPNSWQNLVSVVISGNISFWSPGNIPKT